MNAVNTVCYKVSNLIDGVGNSCITDGFRFIGISVHHADKLLWKNRICHADHSFNRFFICSRHNSRFNRNIDSCNLAAFQKCVEFFVIKEKLAQKVLCPGVNLQFKCVNIAYNIGRRWMALRIACSDNLKTFSVRALFIKFPDKRNQVAGMFKIVKRLPTFNSVTTKGKYIFNSRFLELLQNVKGIFFCHVDTRHVNSAFNAANIFNSAGNFYSVRTVFTSTCPVSYADKIRFYITEL